MKRRLLLVASLLIALQLPVHAYTDPGSGTLIWQLLLAASFGVMFYLRKIINWFRTSRRNRSEHEHLETPNGIESKSKEAS